MTIGFVIFGSLNYNYEEIMYCICHVIYGI